jgi:Copper type II ascorbate-dependent monooxygenase, C-terminal domain
MSTTQEIHYNNPDLDEGKIDPDTGVRFYYTTKLRQQEMGVLLLGDVAGSLYKTPVGDGFVEYNYNCPSTCSRFVLTKPVTFLFEVLHAHQSARALRLQVKRNGRVIHTGRADFFEFDQQGAQMLQGDPYKFRPGDEIDVSCTYEGSPTLMFGRASYQEMCLIYVVYYPRQKFLGRIPWLCGPAIAPYYPCIAQSTRNALASADNINRQFGTTNGAPSSRLCISYTCSMFFGLLKGQQIHGEIYGRCFQVCSFSGLLTSYMVSPHTQGWNCGPCD